MTRKRPGRSPTTAESLREYGRGIGGGFLFSLPLFFTMETWHAAVTVGPGRLLFAVGATFLLLCGYNLYAGLRHDSTLTEVLIDSVEEMGIGLMLSVCLLYLLGRLEPAAPLTEHLGLIVLEGMFAAVGVSVGTAQLSSGDDDNSGGPQGPRHSISSEVVLAMCGSVLIAANVAPTEEVLVLASEMPVFRLLAVMALSIAIAALLLFYSDFKGSSRFAGGRSPFGVLHGSAITYVAALFASAILLWFFGRFAHHAASINAAQCVVLGFPATLGAAAGRLLLR
ncbi:MAG: TIGR02587 family membrane protein [Acidobacteriota bacterium]|nr:TIGR02587 family membrane protein [Acidobacteriota bacterium]